MMKGRKNILSVECIGRINISLDLNPNISGSKVSSSPRAKNVNDTHNNGKNEMIFKLTDHTNQNSMRRDRYDQ